LKDVNTASREKAAMPIASIGNLVPIRIEHLLAFWLADIGL